MRPAKRTKRSTPGRVAHGGSWTRGGAGRTELRQQRASSAPHTRPCETAPALNTRNEIFFSYAHRPCVYLMRVIRAVAEHDLGGSESEEGFT